MIFISYEKYKIANNAKNECENRIIIILNNSYEDVKNLLNLFQLNLK